MTSIIIVTYNNLELTKLCIESIKKHTKDYELIVIDNGSSDGSYNYIADNSDYRIFNKDNLGFVKAVNQGLSLARGEYVCLLNNDIVVTEGWLDGMLKYYTLLSDVGIVGCKSNIVSGYAMDKEFYSGYDSCYIDMYAKKTRKNHFNKIRISPRITGLCMLFPMSLVYDIGKFDEIYGIGNYEDDDFSLRVHNAGYVNLIADDVFIFHWGSASFGKDIESYLKLLDRNEKIFESKWGELPNIIWERIYGE